MDKHHTISAQSVSSFLGAHILMSRVWKVVTKYFIQSEKPLRERYFKMQNCSVKLCQVRGHHTRYCPGKVCATVQNEEDTLFASLCC